MANLLKMAEHQAILGLARLKWSYRRIAAQLGVDRETVARHVRAALLDPAADSSGMDPPGSNAAISITGSAAGAAAGSSGTGPAAADAANVIAGSALSDGGGQARGRDPNAAISITGSELPAAGRQSLCQPWQDVIIQGLEQGLTARRIWQDLVADHGFAGDYQSVQRFVRNLKRATPLPFRRMECDAGAEAQVDFGKGAAIVTSEGKRTRPHLFRVVLSCSRKAYSEVVPRQTTEQFIRCLENAFVFFGGVPRTLVVDNLKAAVIKADWYDPELNPKIQEFARHYGTVILPTRPRTPRHKGKIERGVGYAQGNALKGRTFKSLAEQNQFLAEWESSIADTRIHGTTRQQVGKLFTEVEKPALLPLPPGRFPCFAEAQRTVNRDGHVEVAKAYYSAPPEFVGRVIWARWDGRIVRLFDQNLRQIAVHAQHEPGRFATDAAHIVAEKRGGIERGAAWWLAKAAAIGPHAGAWAQSVIHQRGIHALRVVMGLVNLTHHHQSGHLERACQVAHSHSAYRLRDLRNLLKRGGGMEQGELAFADQHPLIRPLSDYSQLIHDAFDKTPVEARSSAI